MPAVIAAIVTAVLLMGVVVAGVTIEHLKPGVRVGANPSPYAELTTGGSGSSGSSGNEGGTGGLVVALGVLAALVGAVFVIFKR